MKLVTIHFRGDLGITETWQLLSLKVHQNVYEVYAKLPQGKTRFYYPISDVLEVKVVEL
jgi:hypothetical protein